MFIDNYYVVVEKYSEQHYLKNFIKKYKTAWDITWSAMIEEFRRIDELLKTSIAETIINKDNIKIIKSEFRIAGSNESRKTSGNRCIVAIHENAKSVYVLLVYNKNDIGGNNETAKWKQIIKENYPQYYDLF